jgi:two-component system, NtrC family, sensor kinase
MRLVIQLVVASLCATIVVLALYAYVSLSLQRDEFIEDMRDDHDAIVGVLVEAIEAAAAELGEARAHELVAAVNRREDNVQIEWRPFDVTRDDAGEGVVHISIPDDESIVRSWASLRVDGATVGTLELTESFAPHERDLQGRAWRLGLTALVMIATGLLVGGSAGAVLVGRRVRALVDHARRIADGDLDARIVQGVGAKDELGVLGRELNDMTMRLDAARRRLEQESRARLEALAQLRHGERLMTVGKLAAGIAHELGTPLNVVTESAKMIARGETTAGETTEYATIVAEQGERMTRIVRQLLDFARVQAPRRVDADLVALTRASATLLAPLAERHGVQLRIEADAALPATALDPLQIGQVLTNLIVNAIQASPPGAEVVVRVAAHPDGGASLEIVDCGSGIAADDLPHVFEPFFTTKDVGQGTGLGLSVAHGLVAEHGGRIEVSSEPGRGTTFRVVLPIRGGEGASTAEILPG